MSKNTRNSKDDQNDHAKPFRALGYDSGIMYLISKQQLQVLPFKARDLKEANLLLLAPLRWWINQYPQYDNAGNVKNTPDWTKAADDIIQSCNASGVYSPEAIKGLGFWRDGDRVIRHMGNILEDVASGNPISMLDKSLKGVYQRDAKQDVATTERATDEQLGLFLDAVNRIYWKHETHGQLLLGWIALAPFCGLLDWRPHIWVTGEHGAGKSDTVLEAIRVGMGSGHFISAKGSTTEAGLRQRLKCNAIPAVIDESEPNTNKDRLRLDGLLTLARNASSDDEAIAIKGTVSGEASSFRIRTMCCFASINPYIKELADQSRIAVLEIEKKPQTTATKDDFQTIKRNFLALDKLNFGTLFTNLIISRLATLEANLLVFIEAAGDILGSARDGKQYGSLLAGYTTLLSDKPVDLGTARSYVECIQLITMVDENRDTKATGWDECWAKMCAIMLTFRDSRSRVTVGEALEMLQSKNYEDLARIVGYEAGSDAGGAFLERAAFAGRKEVERALRKLGIIYQDGTTSLYGCVGEGVYIANSSEEMSKALAGTAFQNWKQHSARAGETTKRAIKFSNQVAKATFITF
jgi:putative DNA primase/helicase